MMTKAQAQGPVESVGIRNVIFATTLAGGKFVLCEILKIQRTIFERWKIGTDIKQGFSITQYVL